MSSDKEELKYEQALGLEQCVDYLESIVAALRAGQVRMSYGDREMVLRPGSQVHTEIHAKQKSKRTTLTLQLSWQEELRSIEQADFQVHGGKPEPGAEGQAEGQDTGHQAEGVGHMHPQGQRETHEQVHP